MKFPQGKAFSCISISIFTCFTLNSIFDFCFHLRFCVKKKIQHKKPHCDPRVFALGHIRQPRTSGCNFYLFIFVLSIKCHWKPNHHHADMARLMSKEAYVFLSPEFPLLRIIFMSVSNPRFLWSIITKVQTISYNNSLAQLFFFISMVCLNSFF
jgi:hypothetical protein